MHMFGREGQERPRAALSGCTGLQPEPAEIAHPRYTRWRLHSRRA